MATPTPLFTAQQLSDLVQETVAENTAVAVEHVVWGWLAPSLNLTERPVDDEQVTSWALELGAIAYENPTGLSMYQLGQERWSYSSERRTAILEDARGRRSGGASGGPIGSFPEPRAWPDPIEW